MSQTAIDTNGSIRATTASDGDDADSTATGGSTTVAGLSKDTLFEILKNRRRREALAYLKLNGGTGKLGEMAEHIAARENGVELGALSSSQRKRVYIGLYQCHLPKMATAGVVDFDKNRGTVALRALAARLYPYLDAEGGERDATRTATAVADAVPPETTPAPAASAVLAGLGVAALAGVAGVPGFELLSPVVWAVVCALGLLVAAVLPRLRD